MTTNLREHCVFAHHNLLSDPPFSALDLICCRNVLIYLGQPQQQQVIPMLHYALNPGGALMLGASEQLLGVNNMFTSLDTVQRLYLRTAGVPRYPFSALPYVPSSTPALQSRGTPTHTPGNHLIQQIAHLIMATHYAQPGVLITANYTILHIYGHTGRYLEPAPGETGMNLLRMARDGLLAAIQRGVEQAVSEQTIARIERVQLLTPGVTQHVTIEVTPIRDSRADVLLFLVVFFESPLMHPAIESVAPTGDAAVTLADSWREEVQALRAELASSKVYLRTIISEQVATNNELKLLNEELLSRNEEVQSVNEELQTAKEEVQSMNEELLTVNAELQQRNHEISATNSNLHRLLASIDIPIVVLDRLGAISSFTPPAAQLLRLQATDIGYPLRDDSNGITIPRLATIAAEVQRHGQPAEFPLSGHDGQAYLLRIWPAHGVDDVIDGAVLVWIDVAALKQAEATRRLMELSLLEAQKLESLGVMAGGVAHDFNNLLAIILGNTQLALLDIDAAAPAYPNLRQIEATSERAIDLTRQMLAYAGKSQRDLKVVDLNTLIESTDNLLRASIDKQIILHYALRATPLWTQIDVTQIRQLLVNLVLNAAEATGPTAVSVTIRTAERWLDRTALTAFQVGAHVAPGTYVMLEVVDTGVGMDPPTVAKIFDPFFSTKFTGRGLGLAAIRGIVHGHAGAIRVQSAHGYGTTMSVALPRAPQQAAPEPECVDAQAPQPDLPHGGMVLVIDDEDGVRGVAARLLIRLGFATLAAADGAAGIEQFQYHAQDVVLVLLDVTMPGLDTRQIIESLRAMRANVPILMMSGYPQHALEDMFQTTGYLPKPFTLNQLQAALENAFVKVKGK